MHFTNLHNVFFLFLNSDHYVKAILILVIQQQERSAIMFLNITELNTNILVLLLKKL